MIVCPRCGRVCKDGRALAIHANIMHHVASAHPKTQRNRASAKRPPAPHVAHLRSLLPICPDGPIALLEAVLAVAHYDAKHDARAAAWLREVQHKIAA